MISSSTKAHLSKKLDTKPTPSQTSTHRKPETLKNPSLSISGKYSDEEPTGHSILSSGKEVRDLKKTTEVLERELFSKISEYKATNKAHLEKRGNVFSQVEDCQGELEVIKYSLVDILKEARYTKDELREMREKIDDEMFREADMSTYRMHNDSVPAQLMDLKREIESMSSKLLVTENELRLKKDENLQLKSLIIKLKECVLETGVLERKKIESKCQVCIIT